MLIRKVEIENVRSIRKSTWKVPKTKAKGWHVVLGDNGSGKSSFLRSIALALAGPHEARGLRQSWSDWLTRNEDFGSIKLEISWDADADRFVRKGRQPKTETIDVGVQFRRQADAAEAVELDETKSTPSPDRHVWKSDHGWFCASYGPFRRFTGGDPRNEKLVYSMPRLARHLSIFDERVALTESLEWLRDLKFRKLEKDPEGGLLDNLMTFVNQSGFLPSSVKLEEVTSRGVIFRDANGVDVDVSELSDGYRSVLSMTFELIRQMSLAFDPKDLFSEAHPLQITPEGVVIVDEIDAHLHPTWQRTIGRWLCKHFPNVQFIVSTHSPLVCQSADEGSIFLLPRAGEQGHGRMLKGDDFKRLVYGNVLDAYGTEAFGSESATTRSPKSLELRSRLATLNNKEIIKGLTEKERTEQNDLRAMLPSAASEME